MDDPDDLFSPRSLPATRARRRYELDTYRHGLRARALAECDRQDSEAAADAIGTALTVELDLLDWGLAQTNGSTAKVELVARKVQMLSQINNHRIQRRFS